MELKGKVAIITGSSRGIGKTIALASAKEGANVVVTSRTKVEGTSPLPGNIHQTVSEINALGGGKAIAVACDVTKEEQVEALMQRTVAEFGRIDVIFNNAGGFFVMSPVMNLSSQQWDDIVEPNLRGVFLCCKYVLPIMEKQGSGNILNMSSSAAVRINRKGIAPYAAAKAAVERFSICLADEVKEYNIAVNAYRPGAVRSERVEYIYSQEYDTLARFEPPELVVPSILWLIKQDAHSFTGQVVNRDEFGKTWAIGQG